MLKILFKPPKLFKSKKVKQFIIELLITIFAITITAKSIAQSKDMLANQSASSLDLFSLFNNKKYFVEIDVDDVNVKAVRDFIKSFKNVQDKKWYKISDGFVSSFTKDGVQTKAFYDLKGNRHCILSAFNGSQIPPEIRNDVKRRFYNYNIIVAYEIKFEDDCFYIIKIETASSIKILQLLNGEIEVKGDYKKQ